MVYLQPRWATCDASHRVVTPAGCAGQGCSTAIPAAGSWTNHHLLLKVICAGALGTKFCLEPCGRHGSKTILHRGSALQPAAHVSQVGLHSGQQQEAQNGGSLCICIPQLGMQVREEVCTAKEPLLHPPAGDKAGGCGGGSLAGAAAVLARMAWSTVLQSGAWA